MKKLLSFITIFAIVLCSFSAVFAADGYSFELKYTGTITKNVEKNAEVLLVGTNAPMHSNVRIKVEISGPATPVILATDTNGTEIDIAKTGFWGPEAGFPVGGDFTNTTPIKATFKDEGKYTIKLCLIDVTNGNEVIETKDFQMEVYEDVTEGNVIGNAVTENKIEELPKTGTSVFEYVMYIMAIVAIISVIGIYLNKKKINA